MKKFTAIFLAISFAAFAASCSRPNTGLEASVSSSIEEQLEPVSSAIEEHNSEETVEINAASSAEQTSDENQPKEEAQPPRQSPSSASQNQEIEKPASSTPARDQSGSQGTASSQKQPESQKAPAASSSRPTSGKPVSPSSSESSSSKQEGTTSSRPTITWPSVSSTPSRPSSNTPNATPDLSDRAAQVAKLVNQEREKAGLAPLTLDAELSRNATVRAKEIVTKFDHTRPDGSKFSTAVTIPWKTIGENIAWGQPTPKAVMDAWMNSPGHRANILKASYTKIGVGVYESAGRLYWVQLFAG